MYKQVSWGNRNLMPILSIWLQKLSEGLNAVKIQSNKSSDPAKLQYRDESSQVMSQFFLGLSHTVFIIIILSFRIFFLLQQVVLTLGKKEFSHQHHQKLFVGDESEWVRFF